MCGIVAAIAQRNVVPILIEGLKALEYRGYDSAGVAVLDDGRPASACAAPGSVGELEALLRERSRLRGITGIAHTRWATHGAPTDAQRASARLARQRIARGAQRHHREPRRAARRADTRRLPCSTRRPTPKSSRTWSTTACTHGAPARRRAARRSRRLHGAYAIAVICTRRAAPRGRRAPRLPAAAWASATARTSSPPTRWRCPGAPTRSSTWKKATWSSCTRDARAGRSTRDGTPVDARGARDRAVAPTRSSSARTATTCRRRSSSSRARSPTRSKAHRRRHRAPNCSATTPTRCFKRRRLAC